MSEPPEVPEHFYISNRAKRCSVTHVLSDIFIQVYDIAFSRAGGGKDMFASVGADGSVRMFDLRYSIFP